jgi:uncharacterized protein
MLAEHIAAPLLAEMAAQDTRLDSDVRVVDLPRLAGLVAGRGGELQARVGFHRGPEAGPVVRIEIRGVLPLVCQRCFGPVETQIDIDVTLTAVADDAAADELADPFDSVVLDPQGALRLRDAVEDEILAALPLAPLHADPGQCVSARDQGAREAGERGAQTTRPFAGLATLMSRGQRDD